MLTPLNLSDIIFLDKNMLTCLSNNLERRIVMTSLMDLEKLPLEVCSEKKLCSYTCSYTY